MNLTVEEPSVHDHTAAPMEPVPARVISVVKETYDTFTLTLENPAGYRIPAFRPGQFSMLYVFGVGELPISISGNPNRPDQLVYTIRSVGPATLKLVTMKPGDAVGLRGPFGTAWPLTEARGRDVLLVTGGIGLAPLRPCIYSVLRHRGDFGRLTVLYGARSPRDLLFKKELDAWNYVPDTQVLTTVDYGGVSWHGYVGLVPKLFRFTRIDPANTVVMMCGPEVMMRACIRELEMRGIPADQIYLSMERNMKCAVGFCGHCQLGSLFVCKDGPVFTYSRLMPYLDRHEL